LEQENRCQKQCKQQQALHVGNLSPHPGKLKPKPLVL